MVWVTSIGFGAVIVALYRWTAQLVRVERSHRLMLKEFKVFAPRHASMTDAVNHTALFCALDPVDRPGKRIRF